MADEPNDREEFQVDGVYIQDRDMDNNGIPDFQQNHANGSPENPYYGPDATRSDESARSGAGPALGAGGASSSRSGASEEDVDPTIGRGDYGPDAASDSPYARAQREAAGHYVATVDVSKPGEKDRQSRAGTADAANPSVTNAELKSDSNTNRALDDERYRKALHDLEQRRLRNTPKRKSKIGEEIKRASAAYKTDDKDGLALGKAILGGLKGGLKHAEQQAMEKRAARDNQAADKIARDFVESEAAIRRNEIAEEKIRQAAARDEKKAKEEVAGTGPDNPGPAGSDPKGPGGDGPGGDGPGNGGGPDGPGGGKPQETAQPANDDVKPKENEAPAPEVVKPANENDAPEPLRETGTGRAAERAQALRGETEPATRETSARTPEAKTRDEAGGRDPSDAARSGDVEVRTIQAKQPEAKKPEAKTVERTGAGQSGQKVSSDVAPGDANASAGAGMIMAAVNPPLGIAATAAKSRHAQVEAGAAHEDIRNPKAERVMPKRHGPETASVSVDVPARGAPRSGPRPAPERRLETTGADNVVEFKRPTRAGGIMAQAGSLPRTRRPDVASRGPETAQPRTRIMGVGTAMGRFIENDVRGVGGKGADRDDQSIAAAHRNRGNGR